MTDNQFWWATIYDHPKKVVVEVCINDDDGKPNGIWLPGDDTGIDDHDFERCRVRLIERVLPPGRATAAAIHGALVASSRTGSGYVSRLQGCEVTDEAGETVGHTTLVDGYFDLQRAAEILAAGGGAA